MTTQKKPDAQSKRQSELALLEQSIKLRKAVLDTMKDAQAKLKRAKRFDSEHGIYRMLERAGC